MSEEEFLRSDPHDTYELVELLGEGSYGAVYKALRKDNEKAVAIKILPAEEDMTKLSLEITFLKRLSSPYVVSYIEGYLFENELWIVMEYCAGGSMSDLYEATNTTLEEPELCAIVSYTVLGLHHLHSHRSIHRDVKAGNILLTDEGSAKLADFGVSAQLTNTMQKRKTVIGTPFWMAPEVIQETSYDGRADIWSLGITMLELCEGQPPHFNVHPMRAIFMIPMKPAPTLKQPSKWSPEMVDFLSKCLQKASDQRSTAEELLSHPWISSNIDAITGGCSGLPVLKKLLDDNMAALQRLRTGDDEVVKDEEKDKTIKRESTIARSSTMQRTSERASERAVEVRQKRNSIRNVVTDTMRTSDSSVFTQTARARPPRHGKEGRERPTDADDSSRNREDSSVSRASYDNSDEDDYDDMTEASGTMKFSSTIRRTSESDSKAHADVNAALKYFKKAPSNVQGSDLGKLLVAIERSKSDVDVNNVEELAIQEVKHQIHALEKQYQSDLNELNNAYSVRQQILQASLQKLSSGLKHTPSEYKSRK